MPNLRRALVMASGGRYVVMVITFGSTVIIARLLTPAEFGVSVLGAAVVGTAEAIRELGLGELSCPGKGADPRENADGLHDQPDRHARHSGPSVGAGRGRASDFYEVPKLAEYIRVARSAMPSPRSAPIYAMLSRDMAFGRIAALDVLTTLANAGAAICLVLLGFSYMGLAWASVVSSVCWTALDSTWCQGFLGLPPLARRMAGVLAFGAFGSAQAVLYRASEALYT